MGYELSLVYMISERLLRLPSISTKIFNAERTDYSLRIIAYVKDYSGCSMFINKII